MRTSKALFLAFAAVAAGVTSAATVETKQVYSEAMKTNIPCAVVLPEGYDAAKRYPVVYCLHGAGCDYGLCTVLAMRALADEYGFILACPDGRKTSWWYDSPVDPSMRYETFVAKEFVAWVDAHYATIPEKGGRALTGTSMGGHGSCWLAMRHKDTFGAVGNVHGGVDVTKWPNNWDIRLRLGERDANRETWVRHSVLDAAKTLKDGELALMTVVGTSDFFLNDNRALHELLTRNEVAHDHIEVRGANGPLSSHTLEFFLDAEKRFVFPFLRRFFGGENPSPRTRTFMSYNVCECFGNYQVKGLGMGDRSPERYTNRLEAITRLIRAASPEWCALQEVCHDLTNGVDHVSRFAARTGMHVEFADSASTWPGLHFGGGWGVALLSKKPPLKVRRFTVGRSEKYPRTVLAAEFEDYVVYAAHFTFADPYRMETIADVEAELAKETKPVFLVGDLNLQPSEKELFARLQEKFTILTDGTGNTWPAVDPTQRLDYILVDKAHAEAWRKLRAWSLPEKEASDHRPIFLELAPVVRE